MGKKTTVRKELGLNSLAVTYKGVFHLKNMYEFLHNWIQDEGFEADETTCGKDNFETFYWQRTSSQGVTDYNIWWRMKKSPDNYNTSWFEYRLNLDFLGIAIMKTDVMHEGKKVGAQKGEMTFTITPNVIFDPGTKWNSDAAVSKFSEAFVRRTYKKEIKMHKDIMEDTAFKLQEEIKQFLGLATLIDLGEPYHPEKGLGWG